ncbi:hypothetical protein Csa_023751, partial [Cucumis sativus]
IEDKDEEPERKISKQAALGSSANKAKCKSKSKQPESRKQIWQQRFTAEPEQHLSGNSTSKASSPEAPANPKRRNAVALERFRRVKMAEGF